jgi:hypothetical protein
MNWLLIRNLNAQNVSRAPSLKVANNERCMYVCCEDDPTTTQQRLHIGDSVPGRTYPGCRLAPVCSPLPLRTDDAGSSAHEWADFRGMASTACTCGRIVSRRVGQTLLHNNTITVLHNTRYMSYTLPDIALKSSQGQSTLESSFPKLPLHELRQHKCALQPIQLLSALIVPLMAIVWVLCHKKAGCCLLDTL